ncbi:MAG: ATP-binding cassette domain-containing protein [Verrucomicrobiae bacterium]|nr:ATP-binding cassette domain-containing protein [Verrucomicrobiae bacterium]
MTADGTSTIVILRDLHLGKEGEATGATLEIRAGEFAVVAGPSDGYKTELLFAAAGFKKPRQGTVQLFGIDYYTQMFTDNFLARPRIGFVFQDPVFISGLDSIDNVGLPVFYDARLKPAEIDERLRDVFAAAGFSSYPQGVPDDLSPITRHKLGLARAWIRHPDFVVYDEPARGLDQRGHETIYSLIADYHAARKAEGKPCAGLIGCNDPHLGLDFADHFWVLRSGALTFKGDKNTIRARRESLEKDYLQELRNYENPGD